MKEAIRKILSYYYLSASGKGVTKIIFSNNQFEQFFALRVDRDKIITDHDFCWVSVIIMCSVDQFSRV